MVNDVTDQTELNNVAASWSIGNEGEYALFYEAAGVNGADAVLVEIVGGNALGSTVATFSNADVSNFTGNNIDSFMKFSDIELPPTSDLV